MRVVDWSELPPELIEMIARKITIYADYIRFRAVSVKWSSILSLTPHHLHLQFPWLITFRENEKRIDFIDLLGNKVHRFNLPEILFSEDNIEFHGSAHGWLVVEVSSNTILLNPLTRIQIELPAFPSSTCIRKVVLSSSPTSQDLVAVALTDSEDFAICKKGNEAWSFIEVDQFYCEDVIYYKGLFYAVNREGSLAICDVISGLPSFATVIEPPPLPPIPEFVEDIKLHLVDSFGELLLVFHYFNYVPEPDNFDGHRKTVGFDVYRLDSSGPKWVEVRSLGDRVLFVGGGYLSLCLLVTDFSGCEGNCIYFVIDNDDEVRVKSCSHLGYT